MIKQNQRTKFRIGFLAVFMILTTIIINIAIKLLLFFPWESKIIVGKAHKFHINVPVTISLNDKEKSPVISLKEVQTNNVLSAMKKTFEITSKNLGEYNLELKLFGLIPMRSMTIDVMPETKVIPGGKTVGVKLYTEGLLVLGTGEVIGKDRDTHKPSDRKIESGDVVLKFNNQKIQNLNHLRKLLEKNKDQEATVLIKRDEKLLTAKIKPVQDQGDKKYKLGLWVREGTQGIGTITYYDPVNKKYGALGHAITDIDTEQIMSVENGKILSTEIRDVKKGKKGQPGELIGTFFEDSTILGNIETNTASGIFGRIAEENTRVFDEKTYPIALKDEIKEGKAFILANTLGNKVEKFEIDIQKTYKFNSYSTKQMIIKITDKKLLDRTGGIVQGMSGSPILQDGKIIGAVTHVFVNDPTKGYGIFIENMIKTEKSIRQSNE